MGKRIFQPRKIPYVMLLRGVAAAAIIAAAGFASQTFGDAGVSVTCYNLQKSEHPVGSVVAYDTSRAAAACNSVYYDCRGRCVGCFSDSDYLDVVCVDTRGTIFLK
jgi:hypothetical protein